MGRRAGVLVVEDHPELRRQLGELLEGMGFEVKLASDGEEALKALESFAPRLICLDLCLPEISGYEVCDYVRSDPALQETLVLVISGRTLPMDRAHAIEAGADAFIAKPFELSALVGEIRSLLAERRSRTVAAQATIEAA